MGACHKILLLDDDEDLLDLGAHVFDDADDSWPIGPGLNGESPR